MRGWQYRAPILLIGLFVSSTALASPGNCATKGDGNGDCRIAFDDFEDFSACMSGPGTGGNPVCECYDADDDADTDMGDFAYFQAAFTGPDVIPGCDQSAGEYEPGSRSVVPQTAGSYEFEMKEADGIGPVKWMAPESLRSVYLFSGEAYQEAIDLHIPGRGIDFVWSRKYRSRVGPDTAQGVGWDFGYNAHLEQAGGDLVLHDGNSRADLYRAVQGPAGTIWCAPEFFREISQDPNASYLCRFAQGGTWRFNAFDGSAQEGRLLAIADRHGNALTLAYDPSGRLTTITDTLGRPITVSYNGAGRISSITDFSGRQVQYGYYAAADPNGAPGDLKSVTSPAVTGTPNGNDFPNGKTVTYTYTRGFSNEALNHNLLTVTDAKGQTYLRNTYASAIDPNQPDFDHLVRESFGGPHDNYEFVYEPETPSAANGYAITRAIVNDRNGHVDELLYDKFNRCVVMRELTGRADPNQPTTSSSNGPAGKLRQGDPNAFVTRYEYNENALLTRVIDPEQSVTTYVYEGDLDLFAAVRSKGNLRECIRDPGPRGGNQSELVQECEYDPVLNFDTNQVTRCVDPRGHEILHQYDPEGNCTRIIHRISSIVEDFEYNGFGQLTAYVHPDNGSGHRRRDEYTYYNAGPSTGYLHESIIDAPGLALTTSYEYDTVGNIVRTVDPRGNDTLRIVNQLDQVVRTLSRPVDPNGAIRYAVDNFYDENDNLVRVDVENRDENYALYPNAAITTLYDYDILDECTRVTKEVDLNHSVVTEYEYDAERNRTLVRNGEATNGSQPTNTVTTLYDERDLVYQQIMAAGDPQQSTTQYDYDKNGNTIRTAQGLEGNPEVTTIAYDGYDRMMPTTDPMGNVKMCQYDENGNRVFHQAFGELQDLPGSAGNVRLTEMSSTYDAMDRPIQRDEAFFDPTTQNDIGDGVSSTTTTYSDNSQVLSVTDDNGHAASIQYDTADRRSLVTDAKNNTTAYTYDENSNITSITETDKSDLGLPDEVFVTTFTYDRLDRLTSMMDSSGNTTTYGYDSRDNRVVAVDPLSHETRWEYDGLDRLLSSTTDLDGDGADGDGTDIVVRKVWDDSSRLVQQIDDNGHATVMGHDPLNRPAYKNFADGTSETYTYDAHHNLVGRVDANGTSFTNTYDALDRLTHTSIAVGPGVATDTSFETFAYDGLSRLVSAQDDGVVSTFAWTSLSDMTQETTDGQPTSSTYDGMGNRLSCIYPGGRTLDYTYDALNRLATIKAGQATVSSYLYVGPERIALQQYGNGARTAFTYDGIQGVPNPQQDFGVKCIVGITHTSGATVIDSRTFKWDAMYNKTERHDTRTGGPQLRHTYQYDAAYRMISASEENRVGAVQRNTIYNLDGVGNRTSLGGFGGVTGPYLLDPNVPPADAQVNQYTQTPRDSRQYDENGNLATIVSPIGTTDQQFDAYNRLVFHSDSLTGDTAAYVYDALGRRVRRTVTPGGGSPEEVRYFYDGADVIEDQDPNAATLATYVRGARGDDIVCVETGGQVVYHHSDDAGNVMALTDANGAVVERYEYDDFGAPSIFDGSGTPLATSSVGNLYLFGGCLIDPETGWYVHGNHYLDPQNGRYVSRDPSCMWDSVNRGNAYTYAGGNPWSTARSCGHTYSLYGTQKGARSLSGGGGNDGLRVRVVAKMIAAPGGGVGGGHTGSPLDGDFIRFAAPPGGSGEGTRYAGAGLAAARGHGHVTVLKICASDPGVGYNSSRSNSLRMGGFHGHVTVLKICASDPGVGYNSSRSNNLHMGTPGGGCGAEPRKNVVKFKAGADLAKKVNMAGPGGGGGIGVGGDPIAIRLDPYKSSGQSTGKRIRVSPIGAGGPHDRVGHMTVLRANAGGAGRPRQYVGVAGREDLPYMRASGGGGYCAPCGMWKAVCTNGRRNGEVHMLPACNNISSS